MKVELLNHKQKRVLNIKEYAWIKILELAKFAGWQPVGTEAGQIYQHGLDNKPGTLPPWDGRYYPPDGQFVTKEDAGSLARAIKNSLDDIPDQKVNGSSLLEIFSGEFDGKMLLKNFIEFCGLGGFSIGLE